VEPRAATLDEVAEAYVKLVLAVGQHDPNYVDAFYGPPAWRTTAEKEKKPLEAIGRDAAVLFEKLNHIDTTAIADHAVILRRRYLAQQLSSLAARVRMLEGEKFTFDRESKVLYDAVPPTYPGKHFASIIMQLDTLLPGEGTIRDRYERFRNRFIIPVGKLDTVFKAAIAECRRRTTLHIELPPNESFTVEYVNNTPWGAYNWYKGNATSLIQLNTDLPVYIDRAIDIAAHEGYPGHHVYNALLEERLVRKRGWVEFTVYPLFSPQSLIAEGSANYGVHVVMPEEDRVRFEKNVLYPLAGLDTAEAERYHKVMQLIRGLSYADNEAARGLMNGTMDKPEVLDWFMEYKLQTREEALRELSFVETYRSYVINYNLGEDLVGSYVESHAATPEQRWHVLEQLLSSPRLPSGLAGN
jgi:hypothetical protein